MLDLNAILRHACGNPDGNYDPETNTFSYSEWTVFDATPGEIDHARRVLTKIVTVYGNRKEN